MATKPLGNVKQLIQINAVAEFIVGVGAGKQVSVNASNPSGNTFDVISYSMSAAIATVRGLTRTKHVLESGITQANYSKATTGPVGEEVGVEITILVGPMDVDILVDSLATS